MARITFMVDSKECPEGFAYVLAALGRKPDEEESILHKKLRRGDIVLFQWENVTETEVDRFKMLCRLHDYEIEIGAFDHKYPDALCVKIKHKTDLDLFFEIYKEGEEPAAEVSPVAPVAPVSVPAAPAAPAAAPVALVAPKAEYRVNFFGWCSEDGHDKVWGYVTVGEYLYNFWGKRGKRLAFQQHPEGGWGSDDLYTRSKNKVRSGRKSGAYVEIVPSNIENVVPGFFEEFEKQLTLAKLFENFR